MMHMSFLALFLCMILLAIILQDVASAYLTVNNDGRQISISERRQLKYLKMASDPDLGQEIGRETEFAPMYVTRRCMLIGAASSVSTSLLYQPSTAIAAAARESLDSVLYRIVRVREATQQETRLITTGKFNDVKRANIKLAIKFMVENYRLNDAFIAAATYIPDATTATKLEAGQVGQRAVQNLYTILEYFDAADVQNLKVGQLSGKDQIVLKGLDATRQSIDEFLNYFPKADLDRVISKVEEENELNVKEFDPSLGVLINMPFTKYK